MSSPLARWASASPRFEHLPFLSSADKCQANAPSALSWHCCPFLWLLSEVDLMRILSGSFRQVLARPVLQDPNPPWKLS